MLLALLDSVPKRRVHYGSAAAELEPGRSTRLFTAITTSVCTRMHERKRESERGKSKDERDSNQTRQIAVYCYSNKMG